MEIALTAEEIYALAAAEGARPDPLLTISEWSDTYRTLSQRASAEPGPWRTERTPYLREIMDCLSPSSPVETVVLMKGAQVGGPLALDTPLPTSTGWTTMGRVRVGDVLFDENGEPCRVRSVSPVFRGRPCYRLRLSDGSEFVCDGEHRWVVWDDLGRGKRRLLKTTTAQMLPRYKVRGERNRFAIDLAGPLSTPIADLPLDPYLLGVWLGNGSASMNHITVHESDVEFSELLADCGFDVRFRLPWWRKGRAANILVDPGRKLGRDEDGRFMAVIDREAPSFMACLRDLGVFQNKHIPTNYLRASISQRLALLQGLMDTDGHCTKLGRLEFSTSRERIRDDVYELIMSLGMKATVYASDRAAGFRKYPKRHYRISFLAYSDLPVFRLHRKLQRQKPMDDTCRWTETVRRRIQSIVPTESVPVRCIEVDSASHLYLAGRSMVPTHNTEAGNNWIGYVVHQAPGPMLSVSPTVEMAKRNSKQRIDPLIEESAVLRELVSDPRSRDSGNTMLAKEFPGGILVMTGANSAVGLRSMAARYLFLDEVDAYPGDVDGEGDPVNLALARTRTFARRKIFMISTPKITGRSRIEASFEDSDQRYYWVPCPQCNEYQVLKFAQVRWPKGAPELAVYICEHCQGEIQNHEKHWMLAEGEWRAAEPGAGKAAGFHLSSLYSPVGWFSWADAAAMFEEAQKKPELLQVFINTVLGETWALQGDAPEWQRLYDRREDYRIGSVPKGVLFLTAGIDIQKDRIEIEVVGWGRGKESWSVDYQVLEGQTAEGAVWMKLNAVLNAYYPSASGVNFPIFRYAIDSGYATGEVYTFVRKFGGDRAVVIKGDSRASAPISQPSPVDVGPQGKNVKYGVRVWPVNGSMIKEELYRWLRLDRPTEESGEPYPPGYCHFPKYSEEYFKQITAEQLVTKVVKGYRRTEWQKTRDRNDALDGRCYARAAAAVAGMDRYTDAMWKTIEDHIAEAAKRAGQQMGQPAAPAANQPKPLLRPVQLPVRGRFFTNDPPPRRW